MGAHHVRNRGITEEHAANRHDPHVFRSGKTSISVNVEWVVTIHKRHHDSDPDGPSVCGLGSWAVPGGSMHCMYRTERQKLCPIHELWGHDV